MASPTGRAKLPLRVVTVIAVTAACLAFCLALALLLPAWDAGVHMISLSCAFGAFVLWLWLRFGRFAGVHATAVSTAVLIWRCTVVPSCSLLVWLTSVSVPFAAAAAAAGRRRTSALYGTGSEEEEENEGDAVAAEARLSLFRSLLASTERLQKVVTSAELEPLLVREALSLLPKSDAARLYLAEEESSGLMVREQKAWAGDVTSPNVSGDVHDKRAFVEERSVFVEDTEASSIGALAAAGAKSAEEKDPRASARCVISVPLVVSEHTSTGLIQKRLGVLRLESPKPRVFSRDDLQAVEFLADVAARALANARLYDHTMHLAITDMLTGLFLPAFFRERANEELLRARREGRKFSLLMADVDRFKAFNDRFGHPAGDEVLRRTARILKSQAKPGELFCRYGGEEFAALLFDSGPETVEAAERMRGELEKERFLGQTAGAVTISFGVAAFPGDGDSVEELIGAADAALYEAKRSGRNRVVAAHRE